jgi:hypothetical protein
MRWTGVEDNSTSEQLARLWDEYVESARRYEEAKQATDAAEAARDAACQACERAHQAWEAACDEEVRYGQAVRQRAGAYRAASDSVFLSRSGIRPESVLPMGREWM